MDISHLDFQILTHVLIPIFLLAFLSGCLRQALHSPPKITGSQDVQEAKTQSMLNRSRILRTRGAAMLPPKSFFLRKRIFTNATQGLLLQAPERNTMQSLENMAKQDPTAAFGSMKGQFVFIILQGAMAYLINSLFSGFLVAKVPFCLPYKFKAMLQRGIDVPSLDVSYVSSLSWYFLVMLSINGLIVLLYPTDKEGQDSDAFPYAPIYNLFVKQTGNIPAAPPMAAFAQPDPRQLFSKEKEVLETVNPNGMFENSITKLSKKWELTI